MDLETALTLNDDEEWTSEISSIERTTGQSPHMRDKVDPRALDVLSLVQRVNGCAVFLSLIERESEVVLLHLEEARRMIVELAERSKLGGEKGLNRHVDFLVASRKNLVLRLRNLEKRCRIQLAFVCSFFFPLCGGELWGLGLGLTLCVCSCIISFREKITGLVLEGWEIWKELLLKSLLEMIMCEGTERR
jgi:hypothetical protein